MSFSVRSPWPPGCQRTATRLTPGTACLSRSRPLPTSSGPRPVNPVTLPPGRARLVTSPLVTGSPAAAKTMGTVLVACLAARVWGCASGHDDINLERNQFGRESGEPLELPLGISVFNHDVAALDVTEVTQSLTEGFAQAGGSGQVARQKAYSRDLGRLLRPGGERRAKEATSQGAEKRTSVHEEPPPDRPSRRDRAEGRPGGPTLPQRQAVWLGLPLALQGSCS